MANSYIAIPTYIGLTKIQQAIWTTTKLPLVYLEYGDGDGSYYKPSPAQTELKNKLDQVIINAITQDEEEGITWVSAIIPTDKANGVIREIGLVDEEGNLCFIANAPDIKKVQLEEGTLIDIPIEIGIKNSYSEYITIPLPSTEDPATQAWVDSNYLKQNVSNLTKEGEDKIKELGAGPIFYDKYTAEGEDPTGEEVVLKDKEGNVLIPFGAALPDEVTIVKNEKGRLMTDLTYVVIGEVTIELTNEEFENVEDIEALPDEEV